MKRKIPFGFYEEEIGRRVKIRLRAARKKRKPRRRYSIRQYDKQLWLCLRVRSYLRKRHGYKRRIRVKAYWRRIVRVKRKPIPREIKEQHEDLIEEERSPRIEYIENYYRQKIRDGDESMESVREKIRQISSLTLEEQTHITRHLKVMTTRRGAK